MVRLAYLRFHWGQSYTFAARNGKYKARAKFGTHDVLEADSPDELLGMIHRHYPGTSADLCGT